ncbi:MAG TPA: NAD(P)H-dependent glycerol-3-phosphate dehydrogenase [Peptococcaceae bacterium]|nr:MAG: Glycerol-3-phosphate dehydrogenase [NAD(P)+] [Moorella sp. 60_41]HBT46434.1 NAD(P)H-dependent glycerol-3-phosphate dehydrogenase [Peptococcaceae bacterium]
MDLKLTVLGAGSWGTALAALLVRKGYRVVLWARRSEVARRIREKQENTDYLPGVILPATLVVETDLARALDGTDVVVFSVPSQAVRETARLVKPHLKPETVVVNTAKGLELDSGLRLSQVLKEEGLNTLAVLSGPSHAEEVGRGLPTTVVVAAERRKIAEYVQNIFMGPSFRVYTNPDLVGVELGGALKNIIALATGMSDGLGLGDNARAALMTRGLAEIARLGVAMGASPLTFAGLAGLGDLIVTCSSMYSRNRQAGIGLGRGLPLEEVLAQVGMVVEGVRTTAAARRLAHQLGVPMPVTEEVYQVLYNGKPARECVGALMERKPTMETNFLGAGWSD